jgi:ATP-binding cassette subfamily B protein
MPDGKSKADAGVPAPAGASPSGAALPPGTASPSGSATSVGAAARDAGSDRIQAPPPVPGRPMGGFGGHRGGAPARPKSFAATMRRLWGWLRPERGKFALAFLAVLGTSAVALAAPYGIGVAVGAMEAETGVQFDLLRTVIFVLAVAYTAEALLALLQGWVMAGISQRVVKQLRTALFAKLQKLPLSFFDARPHGELMSRLANDVDNVSSSLSQPVVQFMSGLIALAGSLVMMLVISPLLTLASLITVPLVYGLVRVITRKTRVLFKDQQVELGRLNGHVEETITGIRTVKAFNREERVIESFDELNVRLYDTGLKAQIWSGFLMPLLNVIGNIGFSAVAVVGGLLAVKGHIGVWAIASFMTYSRQFVRPLHDMANLYNMLQAGAAGAERVFEVLDEREEPADPPNAVELKNPRGHVVFENVHFAYRDDAPILRDVSFTAPAGTIMALVGPTGAGKTTIVNLLARFYDVTEGRILIDGRDIREYTRDSLRRCFGVVLQDTYLFAGTIRENIKYGKPDATDEEMEQAARLAGADRFIRRLPRGYDTMLTENGGNLSHGERQLLAIARVMLTEPSILILDEATSSIDTRTERQIQRALLNLMKGRTSFVIAHRLNTIREADEIMVIENGAVVERGSHAELLQRQGAYRRLYEA